jgi:hypothetical protein
VHDSIFKSSPRVTFNKVAEKWTYQSPDYSHLSKDYRSYSSARSDWPTQRDRWDDITTRQKSIHKMDTDFQPSDRRLTYFPASGRGFPVQAHNESGNKGEKQTRSSCVSEFGHLPFGVPHSVPSQINHQFYMDSSHDPIVGNDHSTVEPHSSFGRSSHDRQVLSSFQRFDDDESPMIKQFAFKKTECDSSSTKPKVTSLHAHPKSGLNENNGNVSRFSSCKTIDILPPAEVKLADGTLHPSLSGDVPDDKRISQLAMGRQQLAGSVCRRSNSESPKNAMKLPDRFSMGNGGDWVLECQPWNRSGYLHPSKPMRPVETNCRTKQSTRQRERLENAENLTVDKQLGSNGTSCLRIAGPNRQDVTLTVPQALHDSSCRSRNGRSFESNVAEGHKTDFRTIEKIVTENERRKNSGQWLAFVNGGQHSETAGNATKHTVRLMRIQAVPPTLFVLHVRRERLHINNTFITVNYYSY